MNLQNWGKPRNSGRIQGYQSVFQSFLFIWYLKYFTSMLIQKSLDRNLVSDSQSSAVLISYSSQMEFHEWDLSFSIISISCWIVEWENVMRELWENNCIRKDIYKTSNVGHGGIYFQKNFVSPIQIPCRAPWNRLQIFPFLWNFSYLMSYLEQAE